MSSKDPPQEHIERAILHEEIGSLRADVETFRKQRNDADKEISRLRRKLGLKTVFWFTLAILTGSAAITAVGYMFWKAVNSELTNTCYTVEHQKCVDGYQLRRVVIWGDDHYLGEYTSINEALEAAEKQGCVLPK